MLTGLGSFARVAILDRRGVGLSDRLSPQDLPPLEVVMDDVVTVMDDAGIERSAVFGWQSGATHAALLAATYPDRISQLVTFALDPCPLQKPGWTHAWNHGEWENYLSELRQGWEPVTGSGSMSPSSCQGLRLCTSRTGRWRCSSYRRIRRRRRRSSGSTWKPTSGLSCLLSMYPRSCCTALRLRLCRRRSRPLWLRRSTVQPW
jgi:pimeloyl-ACP methyl ester carboxylesterase